MRPPERKPLLGHGTQGPSQQPRSEILTVPATLPVDCAYDPAHWARNVI
jgi:hypothetical protein